MFMRLNVLDLFTTPLRLCQPQLSLFRRSQTAALGSGGISEAKHIFLLQKLPSLFIHQDGPGV